MKGVYKGNDSWAPLWNLWDFCAAASRSTEGGGPIWLWLWGLALGAYGCAKTPQNYCPFPFHPRLDMCVYWYQH